MSSWGIQSREDLSEWIHNQGFVQPRWGAHFCARAQERILHGAVTRDVRCTARNQHAYRSRCKHAKGCPQNRPIKCSQLMTVSAHRQHPSSPVLPHLGRCWTTLMWYHTRFNVLQNCPVHLKGRFRQATRIALEARHQAALAEDATGDSRLEVVLCVAVLVVAPPSRWVTCGQS